MTRIGPNMNFALFNSRGTVHISSTDPQIPPTSMYSNLQVNFFKFWRWGAVNPNYLTNAQDFSLLANATMLVRQIASLPAVKSLYSAELLPGPTVQTDNDFLTFVENNYLPVFHPIGTAAMLPESLGGVVDSNLRVYGVEGVRVVGKLFYNRVLLLPCWHSEMYWPLYFLHGRCFYHSIPTFGSSFFYGVWDRWKGPSRVVDYILR